MSALPRKVLAQQFGEERAAFIARAVAGYSDEPVQARPRHEALVTPCKCIGTPCLRFSSRPVLPSYIAGTREQALEFMQSGPKSPSKQPRPLMSSLKRPCARRRHLSCLSAKPKGAPCAPSLQVKELAKSMLAAKSFETANQMPALERWMGILAEELADRLAEDCATHNRRPRLLTLYYR